MPAFYVQNNAPKYVRDAGGAFLKVTTPIHGMEAVAMRADAASAWNILPPVGIEACTLPAAYDNDRMTSELKSMIKLAIVGLIEDMRKEADTANPAPFDMAGPGDPLEGIGRVMGEFRRGAQLELDADAEKQARTAEPYRGPWVIRSKKTNGKTFLRVTEQGRYDWVMFTEEAPTNFATTDKARELIADERDNPDLYDIIPAREVPRADPTTR